MSNHRLHTLMLSTDRTILDAGSPARKRMEEYARALGTLTVIVATRGAARQKIEAGAELSLYPTNSGSRLGSFFDLVTVGKTVRGAEVVTAQDPFEIGMAGYVLARTHGIPLHLQVHTDFFARGFARAHWPLNALRRLLADFLIPRASGVRVVSASIREKIGRRYGPAVPVSVLPIFVDVERYRSITRASHPRFRIVLLSVSRLEREKRLSQVIEALKKARDAGFDAGLTLVGEGREAARLRRRVQTLGLSPWVEFRGFQNDLILYYAMADVLLYPGASYEGFGMTIIEALAAGVPVLANDVGIAREAGAEIAHGDFGAALVSFLKKGPPRGVLRWRPYRSKEEYLARFVDDLEQTLTHSS